MLRELKHAQQAQRRGEGGPKWRLYESPTGKVPKDLVTMFAGIPTPQIKSAKGPLIELKIQSGQHNPRFLFVVCDDVAVLLTAFPKKTQKLRRADVARADDRFQTMKDGCS